MQQVVYKCDHCRKIIGNKPHISLILNLNQACGIAYPLDNEAWRVERFNNGFLHFCTPEHVATYFGTKLAGVVTKLKAKD